MADLPSRRCIRMICLMWVEHTLTSPTHLVWQADPARTKPDSTLITSHIYQLLTTDDVPSQTNISILYNNAFQTIKFMMDEDNPRDLRRVAVPKYGCQDLLCPSRIIQHRDRRGRGQAYQDSDRMGPEPKQSRKPFCVPAR